MIKTGEDIVNMKGDLTREEIERYGEMLDNQEYRDAVGIKGDSGLYTITSNPKGYVLEGDEREYLMMTGRLGAIRYIKTLEEMLKEEAKSYINKEDGK